MTYLKHNAVVNAMYNATEFTMCNFLNYSNIYLLT